LLGRHCSIIWLIKQLPPAHFLLFSKFAQFFPWLQPVQDHHLPPADADEAAGWGHVLRPLFIHRWHSTPGARNKGSRFPPDISDHAHNSASRHLLNGPQIQTSAKLVLTQLAGLDFLSNFVGVLIITCTKPRRVVSGLCVCNARACTKLVPCLLSARAFTS
jgi:hypothetical protein